MKALNDIKKTIKSMFESSIIERELKRIQPENKKVNKYSRIVSTIKLLSFPLTLVLFIAGLAFILVANVLGKIATLLGILFTFFNECLWFNPSFVGIDEDTIVQAMHNIMEEGTNE